MADQVSARVRTLVDGTLDRVFDEPFDVRTAAEFEDLVAAGPIGNGPGPAATSLGAFVAAATPLARRALVGRDQVVEGGDQGPAAVVEGGQDRARLDPDRAAPHHHHPARRPRARSCSRRT